MTEDPYGSREAASLYVARRRRSLPRRISKRYETWRVARAAAPAGRLVDVACGDARHEAFASCDRSRGMLALAKHAGARLVRADAQALPFPPGAFDTALCVRLLHHLEPGARRRVLCELARVARTAVVTYFGDRGFKARRRLRKGTHRTRRPLARGEFAAACAAAGWRVARDRALWPLWSEQRIVTLRREDSPRSHGERGEDK